MNLFYDLMTHSKLLHSFAGKKNETDAVHIRFIAMHDS